MPVCNPNTPSHLSNIGLPSKEVNTTYETFLAIVEQSKMFNQDVRLPQISYFQNPITNTNPDTVINIEQLYKIITSDEDIRLICERIRSSSKEEQKQIKRKELPYVTPSGTFYKRANNELICHSRYLCLDFDNMLPENMEYFKSSLLRDEQIPMVIMFNSPTNKGFKCFILIPSDAETHGQYFDAVGNYIQTVYSQEVDKSGRDVARACYLSHDPNTYILPEWDLEPLDEKFLKKWLTKASSTPISVEDHANLNVTSDNDDNITAQKLSRVNRLIQMLEETQTDLTTHYQNWVNIGFALCELGEEGREPFHKISGVYEGYDIDTTDDKYSVLLDKYDGSISLSTLFHIAKVHNVILDSKEAVEEPVMLKAPLPSETQKPVVVLSSNTKPRTAKQRLKDAEGQAEIKPLLGVIWQTGEVHILFADTGAGKSVWATQIANALSKGQSVMKVLPNENGPQRVLFYDFELSDKQFQKRYSDADGRGYEFSDNLFIDNINFQKLITDNPKSNADDLIIQKIESDIIEIQPQVLIIDNLTFLKSESTQDTSVAMALVRKLNEFKVKYNLSLLVLAHTPKVKAGTPITLNELGGSKHLSNFVDSASAIGKSSKESSLRYIKQAKASRSSEMVFDAQNIITCEMHHEDRFLGFDYIGIEHEAEHLQTASQEQREGNKHEEYELVHRLASEGMSLREISATTGISKSKVGRILKQ